MRAWVPLCVCLGGICASICLVAAAYIPSVVGNLCYSPSQWYPEKFCFLQPQFIPQHAPQRLKLFTLLICIVFCVASRSCGLAPTVLVLHGRDTGTSSELIHCLLWLAVFRSCGLAPTVLVLHGRDTGTSSELIHCLLWLAVFMEICILCCIQILWTNSYSPSPAWKGYWY